MTEAICSPLLLEHLFKYVPALSATSAAAAAATISPTAVYAGILLRMLERAQAIPCYPNRGGLAHLASKAFDFIQSEKTFGSSILSELLPKCLQAYRATGKHMI